jgi:ADP-heptose:LPS heptosyltransferase
MQRPLKILAIQFKYFGDTVMMVPALRAIRERYPDCVLHALVPEEVAPLLQHLPWLARLWPMPRIRGRASFRQNWPVVRALRAERFDRSVDFGGNDRGAILSFLCGARERLGTDGPGGFIGRRFCFTERVGSAPLDQHEAQRLLHILSAWNIASASPLECEIHTTAAQDALAAQVLPEKKIICHIASSQPKKEWPVDHWAALYPLAAHAGLELIFSTGLGKRERSLLEEFRHRAPEAPVLPPVADLGTYLAVIKRASLFISGDTGPLHFAAGLGVPTVALFGPTSVIQWRPLGRGHQILNGGSCVCSGDTAVCRNSTHCLSQISPGQVLDRLKEMVVNSQKGCFPRQTGENTSGTETSCKSIQKS